MKILVTSEHFLPKIGGVERSLHGIATTLNNLGNDVTIITRRYDPSLSLLEKSKAYNIIRYESNVKTYNIFYALKLFMFLRSYYRSVNLPAYDMVIVRDAVSACALIGLHDKIVYVPAAFIIDFFDGFLSFRDLYSNLKLLVRYTRFKLFSIFEKRAVRRINNIYVFSKNMKAQITKHTGWTDHIKINHPGVSLEINHKNIINRISKKTHTDKIIFVFVGRLIAVKNVDLIMRAFNEIEADNVELHIIGDGDQKRALIKLRNTLKNRRKIKILGRKNNVIDIYSNAHYSITASSYETFGFNILESLACGTPVIGFGSTKTDLDVALEEMVHDNKNGFIAHQYSQKALTEQLTRAYDLHANNILDYKNMCMRASKITNEYNWKNFVNKILHEVQA